MQYPIRFTRKTYANIALPDWLCVKTCPAIDRHAEVLGCMISMRWTWVIVTMLYGMNVPLLASAEPSLTIPRTFSTIDHQLQEEALYLKEETISVASRYEQPISKAPSDVYVITDEDIRNSGATDIPTLLRQVPGMEVMQMNAVDFNVSVRGNNQLVANKLLVLVDGRSIYSQALNY